MSALAADAPVQLRASLPTAVPDALTSHAPHIASDDAVVLPLVRRDRRVIDAGMARPAVGSDAVGVPCAARPSTGFRHLDGPCQCFFGGPAPVFPVVLDLAASDPARTGIHPPPSPDAPPQTETAERVPGGRGLSAGWARIWHGRRRDARR